ncbi:MAG: hypothetical protein AB7I79_18670 [Rhizobiaceae bacterium]
MKRLVLGFVGAILLAFAASAQEVTFPEVGDSVPGVDGATYLDLVREVVTDAAIGPDGWATGTKVTPLRHVAGDDRTVLPPERAVLETGISALPLADGKRLLLMFEIGRPEGDAANFAVLALYRLDATPRLLDAVDVGYDESNFFLNPPISPLGGGDMILTLGLHFNSSQVYQTTGITLLRGDRFEFIDGVFTFDEHACAFDRTQRIAFDIQPPTGTFATIDASVTELTTLTGEDCGEDPAPQDAERTIANAYEWDAVQERYVPDSDAFERLRQENEQRF